MIDEERENHADEKNEQSNLPGITSSVLAEVTSKMRRTTEIKTTFDFELMKSSLTNRSVDRFPQSICHCFHIESIGRDSLRQLTDTLPLFH